MIDRSVAVLTPHAIGIFNQRPFSSACRPPTKLRVTASTDGLASITDLQYKPESTSETYLSSDGSWGKLMFAVNHLQAVLGAALDVRWLIFLSRR